MTTQKTHRGEKENKNKMFEVTLKDIDDDDDVIFFSIRLIYIKCSIATTKTSTTTMSNRPTIKECTTNALETDLCRKSLDYLKKSLRGDKSTYNYITIQFQTDLHLKTFYCYCHIFRVFVVAVVY